MIRANRRRQVLFQMTAAIVISVIVVPAIAQNDNTDSNLIYRGFRVDISGVKHALNFAAIEASVKHQIDIVADCDAKAEVLAFFRSRLITLNPKIEGDNGRFSANGVETGAAPESPEKPILLHELLHAYHALILPMGTRNQDVLLYFNHAKDARLYPANEYLLTNQMEFFAVTASLYLWGHVSRVPFTRENLKNKQPYYYDWLGQLFGVRK